MEELKITKQKVLEAAEKCSTARIAPETLFPDVFKDALPVFPPIDSIEIRGNTCIQDRNIDAKDYAPNVLWLSSDFDWKIKNAQGGGYLLVINYKS